MRRMVDQLLDLTQARLGGGIVVLPKAMSLSEVTRNVLDELRVGYPECVFEEQIQQELRGQWDPDRLEQVLSNIISNAVHHGRADRPVAVRLRSVDGEAIFEVHNDNEAGQEIPPELMPVLFDPFRRGRHERQRPRGSGLGLFIAREIVVAHGGRIEVRFCPGRRDELPDRPPPGGAGRKGRKTRPEAASGGGIVSQILIVEDDPNLRDTLQDVLVDDGYEVLAASQGVEALSILAAHTPALVILDLYMPVMNGWDLLAAMRADPRMRTIPTLVLTSAPGQAPPDTVVITKPQEIGTFLLAVRTALGK